MLNYCNLGKHDPVNANCKQQGEQTRTGFKRFENAA